MTINSLMSASESILKRMIDSAPGEEFVVSLDPSYCLSQTVRLLVEPQFIRGGICLLDSDHVGFRKTEDGEYLCRVIRNESPQSEAGSSAPLPEEGPKRGRPPGRNRHTHSVSMADVAYDRIMRAVAAEGLEFSEFMEKAGLRLVDALEERRGSVYPSSGPSKSILDEI